MLGRHVWPSVSIGMLLVTVNRLTNDGLQQRVIYFYLQDLWRIAAGTGLVQGQ